MQILVTLNLPQATQLRFWPRLIRFLSDIGQCQCPNKPIVSWQPFRCCDNLGKNGTIFNTTNWWIHHDLNQSPNWELSMGKNIMWAKNHLVMRQQFLKVVHIPCCMARCINLFFIFFQQYNVSFLFSFLLHSSLWLGLHGHQTSNLF